MKHFIIFISMILMIMANFNTLENNKSEDHDYIVQLVFDAIYIMFLLLMVVTH